MAAIYLILAAIVLISAYLWLANYAITRRYPEALKHAQEPWSNEEIQNAYEEALKSPIDVRPFLPPKQNRRYIVLGGSGLVGGWIVNQLLLRGESPSAIRILDLRPPTRPEILEHNVAFIQTDVTSSASLTSAFTASWPSSTISTLPLTVFHCVAFIGASDRHPLALDIYMRVNFEGTKNVLAAAQSQPTTKADPIIFIATSSGSIALSPPTYFPLLPSPFSPPRNFIQYLPNANPPPQTHTLNAPVSNFGSCYAYSKFHAEAHVLSSHSPSTNFLTGSIRPAHAIYGHGVENTNSISYDYLRRGGALTWLKPVLGHFVDARNVSLGHLCLERALLTEHKGRHGAKKEGGRGEEGVGGKAYAITDPNPPVTYNHLYASLALLAHPSTPIAFPTVAPLPLLLIAHVVEAYSLLRRGLTQSKTRNSNSNSVLGKIGKILPELKGDIATLQPAIFNLSTAHFIYDDVAAQRELGYKGCVGTLRGFADAVMDWNGRVERKLKAGREQGEGTKEEIGNREMDGDGNMTFNDIVGSGMDGVRKRTGEVVKVPAVKM